MDMNLTGRFMDAEEAERIEARYGKTLVRKVDSLDEAKRVARIAAAALPGSSVKLGPETPREKAKRLFEEAKAAMAEAGVDAYDLGSYAGAPEEAVDEQGDIAPFGNDIRHQTPTPVGNEVPGDGPQVDPDKSEDDQHDGAPDKQPKGLQVTEHADVTTVSDAAEILTTQYHMTADVLKGGNGRPSRENVLLVAKQVGASFPNLPTS